MSTYTISDIHGCYDEFMELLDRVQFNPVKDTLYVLGDAVDRGDKPIDCLQYIMRTKSVHFLLGNHEAMMLDFYDGINQDRWRRNGCQTTIEQLNTLSEAERDKLFAYLRKRPLYKTITVACRRFFLSHAGLDASLPFCNQSQKALTWSREEFYDLPALKTHTCIFGHTPSMHLHEENNCSIWLDTVYGDKICIDCGCVYGGALTALRLDDGEVFYIKSNRGYPVDNYCYKDDPVPVVFFEADRPKKD